MFTYTTPTRRSDPSLVAPSRPLQLPRDMPATDRDRDRDRDRATATATTTATATAIAKTTTPAIKAATENATKRTQRLQQQKEDTAEEDDDDDEEEGAPVPVGITNHIDPDLRGNDEDSADVDHASSEAMDVDHLEQTVDTNGSADADADADAEAESGNNAEAENDANAKPTTSNSKLFCAQLASLTEEISNSIVEIQSLLPDIHEKNQLFISYCKHLSNSENDSDTHESFKDYVQRIIREPLMEVDDVSFHQDDAVTNPNINPNADDKVQVNSSTEAAVRNIENGIAQAYAQSMSSNKGSSLQPSSGNVSTSTATSPPLTSQAQAIANHSYRVNTAPLLPLIPGTRIPDIDLNAQAKTVEDIWEEWHFGHRNKPALKLLEKKYGTRWRRGRIAKSAQRRKKVIEFIESEYRKHPGVFKSIMTVVNDLDNYRLSKGKGLFWLYGALPERLYDDGGNTLFTVNHEKLNAMKRKEEKEQKDEEDAEAAAAEAAVETTTASSEKDEQIQRVEGADGQAKHLTTKNNAGTTSTFRAKLDVNGKKKAKTAMTENLHVQEHEQNEVTEAALEAAAKIDENNIDPNLGQLKSDARKSDDADNVNGNDEDTDKGDEFQELQESAKEELEKELASTTEQSKSKKDQIKKATTSAIIPEDDNDNDNDEDEDEDDDVNMPSVADVAAMASMSVEGDYEDHGLVDSAALAAAARHVAAQQRIRYESKSRVVDADNDHVKENDEENENQANVHENDNDDDIDVDVDLDDLDVDAEIEKENLSMNKYISTDGSSN
jgi:hypothetical protein